MCIQILRLKLCYESCSRVRKAEFRLLDYFVGVVSQNLDVFLSFSFCFVFFPNLQNGECDHCVPGEVL